MQSRQALGGRGAVVWAMALWCVVLAICLVSPALAQDAAPSPAVPAAPGSPGSPDATAPTTPPEPAANAAPDVDTQPTFQEKVDDFFGQIVGLIAPVLFFDMSFGSVHGGVPLIVALLLLGGVFFTFRYGFINLRLFGHAIAVIRGKYDDPNDHGEISHFQALTSALSATVGLGNIAGVALAISGGGAGAVFWMWVVAFFGMSSKFTSCTLAQMYRNLEPEEGRKEHVLGGPMLYLDRGVREVLGKTIGLPLGKVLAVSFAFFTIMGALGGGNMFQANQTFEIVSFVALDGEKDYAWLAGLIMAALVAIVIVGGIRRIGDVTSKIVPAMCLFYVIVSLVIIVANAGEVPGIIRSIFEKAFNYQAVGWGGAGGILTIMVTGIKRGAFSNEAGLGSAAIAHSAARTDEPVREGTVAMIGPFIDTIVVCTMTAMVILIAEGQIDPDVREKIDAISTGSDVQGAALTGAAFGTLHGFLPYLLCIAVFIFAYSTMISWSYYGERAIEYLFGKAGIWPYRVVFLSCVVLGPMVSLLNVKDFTDLLILSMAYPNIVGAVILSPKVAAAAKDYRRRLRCGEMEPGTEPPDPAADI